MKEQVVLVSRIPWAKATAVLEAFEEARRDRSKTPLEGLFRSSALDGVEIIRKKKFGWFGEARTVIPRASTFVVAAIEQATREAIDLDSAPLASFDASSPFRADHGLPEWMHGDDGPSLVGPDEIASVRALADRWPAEDARKLVGLLDRVEPGDGLMIEL